ncbi:hypothetical protein AGMMS50230_01590 [Spirochaetia bacterium]|nr:hypothetical protein AGMMS50230_01590 [Spirochaetia bacterium]
MKRKLIWTLVVVFWFALGVLIFVTSRGHSLLLDNRNVESPQIQAPEEITIEIDGQKELSLYRGDRDRLTVTGSKHRIRVTVAGGGAPFEGTFTLPIRGDMYLLSVPKMLAGTEPFVEVFYTVPETRNVEESPADEPLVEPLI